MTSLSPGRTTQLNVSSKAALEGLVKKPLPSAYPHSPSSSFFDFVPDQKPGFRDVRLVSVSRPSCTLRM